MKTEICTVKGVAGRPAGKRAEREQAHSNEDEEL